MAFLLARYVRHRFPLTPDDRFRQDRDRVCPSYPDCQYDNGIFRDFPLTGSTLISTDHHPGLLVPEGPVSFGDRIRMADFFPSLL